MAAILGEEDAEGPEPGEGEGEAGLSDFRIAAEGEAGLSDFRIAAESQSPQSPRRGRQECRVAVRTAMPWLGIERP